MYNFFPIKFSVYGIYSSALNSLEITVIIIRYFSLSRSLMGVLKTYLCLY